MQLGSMFISNCNDTLHVSDAICVHPQEYLKTVVAASGVLTWCLHLTACQTPEASVLGCHTLCTSNQASRIA